MIALPLIWVGSTSSWICAADAADVPEGIIKSSDPTGEPLRTVSREFLTKLADGDAKGTAEMFAGPKDQQELLDACLAAVDAGHTFAKSFKARFPDHSFVKSEEFSDPLEIGRRIRAVKVETFIRQGNTASMSPGGGMVSDGLDFKLVDGQWKVTHLVSLHAVTPSHLEFARKFAETFKAVGAKLDKGEYANGNDALNAIKEKLGPAAEAEQAADKAAMRKH